MSALTHACGTKCHNCKCVRWPPTFGMLTYSISLTKLRFSVTSSLQDLADARVSLTGHAKAMPEERQDAVRSLYKRKNVDSFWADFGDFKPFYMEDIVAVHFNGGFGRAGRKVSSSATASVVHCSYHPVYVCHIVNRGLRGHVKLCMSQADSFSASSSSLLQMQCCKHCN